MTNPAGYVNDIRGMPGFRVTIEDPGEYRDVAFTASVDVVTGWTADGVAVAEYEPYLTCTIKWDGCSHFRFGKPWRDGDGRDGYLHFCGVDDFKNHALLLEALYRIAFREMGREDEDEARW